MDPCAALAVCRFLHDAAAMLVWGAAGYLCTLVPEKLAGTVWRRLRVPGVVAIAVAVATTAASLPFETAVIGAGWSDAFDPATVRDVLTGTSVGQAWQEQAVASALLLVALAATDRWRRGGIALASGLLLAGAALTGHAVMQEGWIGVLHPINDAIHILSAGAWLGALVPLLIILRRLDVPEYRQEAGTALRRFSTAGHVVVALIVASGVINTMLVLGRWPTDWSSPYQALLALKIALVVCMVGIAAFNRYVLVPYIALRGPCAYRMFRRTSAVEVLLGLAVVALVAVFGMLDPS